jgi:hypothetical protein
MTPNERNAAIRQLEAQLLALKQESTAHELLEEIWTELGPYTDALPRELRYRLQDYFEFDDSE